MKFNVIFILLAAGCIGTVGCAAKAARTAPVTTPAAHQPQPAANISAACRLGAKINIGPKSSASAFATKRGQYPRISLGI